MTMVDTVKGYILTTHRCVLKTASKDVYSLPGFSLSVEGSCLANTARVIVRWATAGYGSTCTIIGITLFFFLLIV